jgi:hypothetical protein
MFNFGTDVALVEVGSIKMKIKKNIKLAVSACKA